VPGKAVQIGARTVGYAYYVIVGDLGEIAGLHVLPEWSTPEVGKVLVQETVAALHQRGLQHIESACIAIDCPWLPAVFEPQGFQTYWREFLRVDLRHAQAPAPPPAPVHLEPWQSAQAHEVAVIMQAAYAGSVESTTNALYRSVAGCRLVLENILHQGGCGRFVPAASALARHRGQSIGCIIITEIAPQQSHLVQVVVLPAYQRQGVGRLLLHYSVSRLAALRFETLSLIVSRTNSRAFKMYRAMGMHPVLTFPVFISE
jgi:ribosomal protein S18 acetylase RimI-like enzyme